MGDTLCFDLETQKSFQEVGGRQNLRLLGISVAVTYNPATGEYHDYLENGVAALVEELLGASIVVGFNIISFDYEVLQGYTTERLEKIPTIDILSDVYQQLGFRIGLDALVNATLGLKKSADGLQAIRWYRQGEIAKLLSYCRQDVDVTWRLYDYGRKNGHIVFLDRYGQRRRVKVNW